MGKKNPQESEKLLFSPMPPINLCTFNYLTVDVEYKSKLPLHDERMITEPCKARPQFTSPVSFTQASMLSKLHFVNNKKTLKFIRLAVLILWLIA